jgi:hypothetical protein
MGSELMNSVWEVTFAASIVFAALKWPPWKLPR